MKKALLAFLLISVLAGGAFAQVTFSGSAYVGIQLVVPDSGDESIATAHREESVPTLNFMATVMRENYGVRLDTTFRMMENLNPEPGEARFFGDMELNGIYGWVDFDGFLSDDSFRLTMGQISSTPWVLPRFHHSHAEIEFGNIRGFRADYITPLPGLNVGAALRAEGRNMQDTFERMVFGASYIHPMFSVVFAYDLSANVHTMLGFNFTGIPDLTAGFKLRAGNLASWDNDFTPGTLLLRQRVGYRVMRPLNVFLIMSQEFVNESDTDTWLEFIPGVEYRFLPNLTGSLSVIIESPDHFTTTNLTINPVLEHTLRGPAILYVEYRLHLDNMETVTHTFGFGITISMF